MNDKKELNEQELEKAAGGFSVYEDDSCDRFELSFICSMFGGSYDKTCKNCNHYTATGPDIPGLGHCLFGR